MSSLGGDVTMADRADETTAAERALRENAGWYHTIDLAPGYTTPGQIDLRGVVGKVLPGDLGGRRALDVGTFDGFWAFEMERRGAEVVAVDNDSFDSNDWPPYDRQRLLKEMEASGIELGKGFRLAADALGSSVRRLECDVYEVSPEALGGPVDFAFIGAVLVHLQAPVRALEGIHRTLSVGGELRLMEPVSLPLSVLSRRRPMARFQAVETDWNWWMPNIAAVRSWALAAGFEDLRREAVVRPPSVNWMRQSYAVFSCRRPA